MRGNLLNQAIFLTHPSTQVLFFSEFNIENNFAAFSFRFYFLRFARESRATFPSKQYLVYHAKLERFSINSHIKPTPKVYTKTVR